VDVSHGDGRSDWVEVAGDVLFGILDNIEGLSEVNNSFLHLKAVGVSPEGLVCVESIVHFPVDRHILPLLVLDWHGAQFHV
jgi:hypothetical protein